MWKLRLRSRLVEDFLLFRQENTIILLLEIMYSHETKFESWEEADSVRLGRRCKPSSNLTLQFMHKVLQVLQKWVQAPKALLVPAIIRVGHSLAFGRSCPRTSLLSTSCVLGWILWSLGCLWTLPDRRGLCPLSEDRRWRGHIVGGVTFSSQVRACAGCLRCPLRVPPLMSALLVASRLSAFSLWDCTAANDSLLTRPR